MDARPKMDLGSLADDYARLALHLHNHDPNPYIFIGDKAQQAAIKDDKRALPDLDKAFIRLHQGLAEADTGGNADTRPIGMRCWWTGLMR